NVLMRGKQVVGQNFPVGKMQHRQFAGKKADFFFQSQGTGRIGGNHQRQPRLLLGSGGNGQRLTGTAQTTPEKALGGAGGNRRMKWAVHAGSLSGVRKEAGSVTENAVAG